MGVRIKINSPMRLACIVIGAIALALFVDGSHTLVFLLGATVASFKLNGGQQ